MCRRAGRRAWGASTDRGPGRGGGGEGGLERRAQGKVHFQAAAGLDAQDPHEAGRGRRVSAALCNRLIGRSGENVGAVKEHLAVAAALGLGAYLRRFIRSLGHSSRPATVVLPHCMCSEVSLWKSRAFFLDIPLSR